MTAADRIAELQRQRALDAVRFALEELRRVDAALVRAMCIRVGIAEVSLVHDLGLVDRLEAIDLQGVRLQVAALADELRRTHYQALFPDFACRR